MAIWQKKMPRASALAPQAVSRVRRLSLIECTNINKHICTVEDFKTISGTEKNTS
jgi:hypothetical protein